MKNLYQLKFSFENCETVTIHIPTVHGKHKPNINDNGNQNVSRETFQRENKQLSTQK